MTITSTPKKMLLLCSFCIGLLAATAQQPATQVSGILKNEKGDPIESASVRVKGRSSGTTTDKSGAFSLKASPGDLLVISSVGFESLQVRAGQDLQLVLHSSAGALNEVVVIAYGSQPKKSLTGSISVVTAKDFQQGNITSPEQLIAGKIAGVSITSNGGSPGAGSVIRIRGVASLNAGNDPLIVIDGLPFSGNNIYGTSNNALGMVNGSEIESFTVLKDAAATAIYGSRASSGVIIITTKKGTPGAAKFTFNTQLSVSKLVKEADVLSASQFRQFVDSMGTGTYDNVHTYKSLLGNASTDWQKQIYQTAVSSNHNLSVTGTLKNLPYRLSIGYSDQEGIVKTDHLQRLTAGISLTPKLLQDHLKLEINLKGALNKVRFANAGAAISSAMYFDPTQPVRTKSPYGDYYEWASTDVGSGAVTLNKLAPRNPLALLDLYNNSATVSRSYGNFKADYELPFLSGLHANLNLGYDIAKGSGTIDVPAFAAQNLLDSGQRNKYLNKIGNTVGEFYLNYVKDLPSIRSNINALGGYGYYNNLSTNYSYSNFRANGDSIPGSKPPSLLDKPENTLISYYGRLIYTFNTRYILAGTIRRDGSSRFSPATRWGVFPSLAFTWRVNQERFLEKAKALSNLNLRLSYGITGNQDGIYNYSYLPAYSFSDNASKVLFGNTYYPMGTPAAYDAGIRWEQTATWNAGLDYGFISNRLQGSVDFYYKKTKDLLNTIPIPAGSNFSSTILTNVGNLENKGVEFVITASPVKTTKLSWDLNFNIAYNNNKITNLTATKDSTYPGTLTGNGVIQINSVGYNANAFYVYHQEYNKNGLPVEGVFKDVNGDGVVNEKDLYRYKSPFPKYILGFSTQVTYMKWTISTVLRGNIGNYMYDQIASNAIRANMFNPLGYLANTFKDITRTHFYYSSPQSDYYIQNASFLKMDNLGLSYNAGGIFHKSATLRINANCQNVFTATKYTGQDPELYGGIDNTFYPRPRTYTLGANLQF